MSQPRKAQSTAVLDVRGLHWASEKNVIEAVLSRRSGVQQVDANPVAQTATVVFDPTQTSLAELRKWVTECGYHCAGQSVPTHMCDPMLEPGPVEPSASDHGAHAEHGARKTHAEHTEHAAAAHPGHGEAEMHSAHEAMGHGGHTGMSMQTMVADMRNRFLVAALLSIPIVVWSPIGEDVLGLDVPVPFGLRQDVWALLLSLPVIFYS
ncbi:MAG: heavy metal translocating P-type ATPase, partial [Longispora sp.]|nr:heavy metal translocating P-type ATPase [Longispora sp. (in: high G+C Gram-positive bacteria)]